MNIFIWMNMPSHHQSYFFDKLNEQSTLKVGYYGNVSKDRIALGWQAKNNLKDYEIEINIKKIDSTIEKYDDYIHIVPGYGSTFTRTLAKKLSRQGIIWVHWSEKSTPGIMWYKSYFIKKWYANLVNKYALGVLAQGLQAQQDFYRWGIDKNKNMTYLTYSIMPLNKALLLPEINHWVNGRKVFLFLGQMITRKGVDLLINAFAALKNDKWCMVLVGNGDKKSSYENLISKLGLKEQIKIFPFVNSKEINTVLSVADVFILPSRNDGWGVVLNEALSLNKPLIASDMVGAAWHLIEHGINGFRFKSENVNELSQYMQAYIDNPELIHIHASHAPKIYQKYSSEAMVDNLLTNLSNWLDHEKNSH